jgi:hypothetical protein
LSLSFIFTTVKRESCKYSVGDVMRFDALSNSIKEEEVALIALYSIC